MKRAVSTVGWLAAFLLGAWLGRWATVHLALQNEPVTLAVGTTVMLAWAAGAATVWRHPWLAGVAFAGAAVMPTVPNHQLPAPALVIAVSAALAIWSLLAAMLPLLVRRIRTPRPPIVEDPTAKEPPGVPLTCVICHGTSTTTICALCAAGLSADAELWCTDTADASPQVGVPPHTPDAHEAAWTSSNSTFTGSSTRPYGARSAQGE